MFIQRPNFVESWRTIHAVQFMQNALCGQLSSGSVEWPIKWILGFKNPQKVMKSTREEYNPHSLMSKMPSLSHWVAGPVETIESFPFETIETTAELPNYKDDFSFTAFSFGDHKAILNTFPWIAPLYSTQWNLLIRSCFTMRQFDLETSDRNVPWSGVTERWLSRRFGNWSSIW